MEGGGGDRGGESTVACKRGKGREDRDGKRQKRKEGVRDVLV